MVFFDRLLLVGMVVALLALSLTCSANPCQPDWKEYNGKCYYVWTSISQYEWVDADRACSIARGAQLVVFETKDEDDWVTAYALPILQTRRDQNAKKVSYFWIGLTDHFAQGSFIWNNEKTPLSTGYLHTSEPASAAIASYRFNGSIPSFNYPAGTINCVAAGLAHSNGPKEPPTWRHIGCRHVNNNALYGAVCEKDINECIDPNLCSSQAVCFNSIGSYKCVCNTGYTGDGHVCTPTNNLCPPKWVEYNGKCYGVFSMENETAKNWTAAKNLCAGKSAELVRYETRDEEDFVIFRSGLQFLRLPYKNYKRFFYWIGLRKVNNVYQWSNGKTPADYQYQRFLRFEYLYWVWTAGKICNFASHAMDVITPELRTVKYNGVWDTNYCPENHLTNTTYYLGYVCERDLNECSEIVGACSPDASCTNSMGSFTCTCNTGYTGNGTVCTDVNECLSSSQPCPSNLLCVNTNGAFTCQCNPGYEKVGGSCTDIDECRSMSHTCSRNTQCINTDSSYQCTDIDECASQSHTCSRDAQCTNTYSSYQCQCKTGFTGDGKLCTDIDECASQSHVCSSGTQCTNTDSSYRCTSNIVYTNATTGGGTSRDSTSTGTAPGTSSTASPNPEKTEAGTGREGDSTDTSREGDSTDTSREKAEGAAGSSNVGGVAAGVFFAGLVLGVCCGVGAYYTLTKRQSNKTNRQVSKLELTTTKTLKDLEDSDFDIYARPTEVVGCTSPYINKSIGQSNVKTADLPKPGKPTTGKAKGNVYHKTTVPQSGRQAGIDMGAGLKTVGKNSPPQDLSFSSTHGTKQPTSGCNTAISLDTHSDIYEADLDCPKPAPPRVYQNTPAGAGASLSARIPQPANSASTPATCSAVDDGELYGNADMEEVPGQGCVGKVTSAEEYGNSCIATPAEEYGNCDMMNEGEKNVADDGIYEALSLDESQRAGKTQDPPDDFYMVDTA